MVRLSVLLPPVLSPRTLAAEARQVEEAGLEGVWVADHLRGGSHFSGPWYAMLASLTAVALATECIPIGPLVAGMPMRPAEVLALEMVTLSELAGGRIRMGVGSGAQSDARLTGAPRGTPSQLASYARPLLQRGLDVVVAANIADSVRVAGAVGAGWVTTARGPGLDWVDSGQEPKIDRARTLSRAYQAAGGRGPRLVLIDADEPSPWQSGEAMSQTLQLWGDEGFDEVVVFAPWAYRGVGDEGSDPVGRLGYRGAAQLLG